MIINKATDQTIENKVLFGEVIKHLDLSLDYDSMYEKFLTKWDSDEELSNILKEIYVEDIVEIFDEIKRIYYNPDNRYVINKESTFNEFKSMNQYNLVHALSEKGEHLIFNLTIGVKMSKTSFNKFLKIYSVDDITRARLYCMFYTHSSPKDDFIKNLQQKGIKWKSIEIKNPKRMIHRYPKISA